MNFKTGDKIRLFADQSINAPLGTPTIRHDPSDLNGPLPDLVKCGRLCIAADAPFEFDLAAYPANVFIDSQRSHYRIAGSALQKTAEQQVFKTGDLYAVTEKAYAQSYTLFSETAVDKEFIQYPELLRGGGLKAVQAGFLGNMKFNDFTFTIESLQDGYVALRNKGNKLVHLLPSELSINSNHGGCPGKNTVLTIGHSLDSTLYYTAQWKIRRLSPEDDRVVVYNRGNDTYLRIHSKQCEFAYVRSEALLYPEDPSMQYRTVQFLNFYGLPGQRVCGGLSVEDIEKGQPEGCFWMEKLEG